MRTAEISRKTKETDIYLKLDLDGTGTGKIQTGIGFFDHMLNSFAVHSGIDLEVKVSGDLEVDCHHTVEDVGIVLGKAICEALGDKSGICRYGTSFIPMDEALGFCSLDIGGRPYLSYECDFTNQSAGAFDLCMAKEFFRAVAYNSLITMHISEKAGTNDHHKCEAMFKAFAHAFSQAIAVKPGNKPLSAKGIL